MEPEYCLKSAGPQWRLLVRVVTGVIGHGIGNELIPLEFDVRLEGEG